MHDRPMKNAGAPRRPDPFRRPARRLPDPPRRDDMGDPIQRGAADFANDILYSSAVPVNRGRRVLLAVLPVIAALLMGFLVFLILMMPKRPSRTQLHRLEATTIGTVSAQVSAIETTAAATSAAIRQSSTEGRAAASSAAILSRRRVSEALRVGVGLPPGRQKEAPQIKNPAAAGSVWQPAETVPRPPVQLSDPTESGQLSFPVELTQPLLSTASASLSVPAESAPAATAETPASESSALPSLSAPQNSSEATLPSSAETSASETGAGNQAPRADSKIGSGFTEVNVPAYVYGDIVNVRKNSDLNAEILTVVHAGDVVQELETDGSWSKVMLQDGSIGYIFSNLLSYNYVPPEAPTMDPAAPDVQEDAFQPYDGILYSNFSGLNIRSAPSTSSDVIGTMYYGDNCHAIGYNAGWFKIAWYNGEFAYVHGDYLQTDPIDAVDISEDLQHVDPGYIEAPVPNANLAGGARVANLAQQYVGCPYVFGAAGPDAFDCSGFAMFIYQQMGVQLSRTTYDQVNNGIAVPFGYKDYSNLVPGDLLLFATGGGIGHVGIYIGGGQMVHAGTPATGVIYDDLNLDYWASRLAYVRRILY